MAYEFRESVSHAYLPWMAQCLLKRAGNLHTLYMAFIDYLLLDELVLQETYSQIRAS